LGGLARLLHLPHEVSGPVNRGIEDRHGDGCQSQAKKCYEGWGECAHRSMDWVALLGVARCPASTVGWGEREGAVPNVTQFPSTPTYVEVVAFSKRGRNDISSYDLRICRRRYHRRWTTRCASRLTVRGGQAGREIDAGIDWCHFS
jgi:hypothetical protein